jgi:LuxR family quorum-sensing system transcriptional regulator CciR
MMRLVRIFKTVTSCDELHEALNEATREMGFQRYALSHHGGFFDRDAKSFRLHNYPDQWADFYDRYGLGLNDPVHRASCVTACGFAWEEIPGMISLTERDHLILEMARAEGIAHGYTVPSYVPGESHGSMSFVGSAPAMIDAPILPIAQSIALFAFDAARSLRMERGMIERAEPVRITDRQREILVLVARGMGDRQIAAYLDRSEETITLHVKNLFRLYRVNKRTSLVIQALFDGNLTFTDVHRR